MKHPLKVFVGLLLLLLVGLPSSALAGDAFLKIGLTVHPDIGGFTDRWLVTAGTDWGFNDNGYLGLELQGAYRSNTAVGSALVDSVPANLFLNGKWKSQMDTVRPYAGVGFGLMSAYVTTEVGGSSSSEYVKDGGLQFMTGIELHEKWVFELLGQKVFQDGSKFNWTLLAGVRW